MVEVVVGNGEDGLRLGSSRVEDHCEAHAKEMHVRLQPDDVATRVHGRRTRRRVTRRRISEFAPTKQLDAIPASHRGLAKAIGPDRRARRRDDEGPVMPVGQGMSGGHGRVSTRRGRSGVDIGYGMDDEGVLHWLVPRQAGCSGPA